MCSRQFRIDSLHDTMQLLPLHRSLAYLGGGGKAVEVVALGGNAAGEVAGVPLLFEPMADDNSAGREPTPETVSGAIEAGLVVGDHLVEPAKPSSPNRGGGGQRGP